MDFQRGIKFRSFVEFWEHLPAEEKIIVDVLRQIVRETLPAECTEKLTYNVPFFYGKRRICLIWPASVPWGGINQGVMFGMCQGNRLNDSMNFLNRGTNKQFFYKIYNTADDIDVEPLVSIIQEGVRVDRLFK